MPIWNCKVAVESDLFSSAKLNSWLSQAFNHLGRLRFVHRASATLAVLSLCSSLVASAQGQPRGQRGTGAAASGAAPHFITFEAPGAGNGMMQGTIAIGINNEGDVTGFYYVAGVVAHGYVRSAGGIITDFDAPGAGTSANQGTFPIGINASGEIAGMYSDSNNVYHGFVRAADGTISSFDVPGAGKITHHGTIPLGIDAAGDVAGTFETASSVYRGFVRAASGKITTFSAPGAGTNGSHGTIPTSISPSGEVAGIYSGSGAGYHGFVRTAGGSITDFDAPSAGANGGTIPIAINAGGEIAGTYIDASNVSHGFTRSAGGTITQFDLPGAGVGSSGFVLSVAGGFGINAGGDIAGLYADSHSVFHGFVRAAGGTVTAFEAPGSGAGMGIFEGSGAFGINAAGAVAGTFADAKSVFHGFVLAAMQPSTTSIKSSLSTSTYGRPVTLTAEVSSSDGAIADGETVSFMKGTAILGTAALSDGVARLTTTTLPVGATAISAVYAGDPNFAGSASKAITEVVAKGGARIALTSPSNSSKFGEAVKFAAVVSAATSGIPAGTVTFKNGSATLGTVVLSAGTAAFTTSKLPVGPHAITAEYSGSADYTAKTSSALSHTVSKQGTAVALASSLNPSTFEHAVKFTATVSGAISGVPSGTVTFKNGATALGTVALSAGQASFTTSALSAKVHSITALYSGNADYAASTSAALTQTVNH